MTDSSTAQQSGLLLAASAAERSRAAAAAAAVSGGGASDQSPGKLLDKLVAEGMNLQAASAPNYLGHHAQHHHLAAYHYGLEAAAAVQQQQAMIQAPRPIGESTGKNLNNFTFETTFMYQKQFLVYI